jgi:HEPN domain-containing protein
LKAFLTWHNQIFRKTHNLIELGESCAGIENELEPLLRSAAPLTQYASRFRYPGGAEEPSREEAEQALTKSQEVYEAILERVPKEVHP